MNTTTADGETKTTLTIGGDRWTLLSGRGRYVWICNDRKVAYEQVTIAVKNAMFFEKAGG